MTETAFEMARRACETIDNCNECPFRGGEVCTLAQVGFMPELLEGLYEWAKEHPTEPTYKDVFLEKFPKATILDGNTMLICKNNVFGASYDCLRMSSCEKCWNEPYKE